MNQSDIILSTLNARYIHCALGLRYLYAHMDELQNRTTIQEFMINDQTLDMAEILLKQNPKIIGFGLYIWNIDQTVALIKTLKSINPEIIIVAGGPEISFEYEQSLVFDDVDYIITGQADLQFKLMCSQILKGFATDKVIHAATPSPTLLKFPYEFYNEEDIKQRVLYVEASRGCPFKCEFCLSSLDKTAKPFDIDLFLQQMDKLYQRGARSFKFVDRTFNLNIKVSSQILNFFLAKNDSNLFLHFELIPDRLPEALKALILKFPAGNVQFEIGIQTFNSEVQQLISRTQDHQQTLENLSWLSTQTEVHLHTDLIAGLPSETLKSFADSFNQLIALGVEEIQVGILKRLRGTPIIRHSNEYQMVYDQNAPYSILKNSTLSFTDLQNLTRFARYWNLIGNSGRFKHSLSHLLKQDAFNEFMKFSVWLHKTTQQTHKIALARLFKLIHQYIGDNEEFLVDLELDFEHTGIKKKLIHLLQETTKITKPPSASQRQKLHIP